MVLKICKTGCALLSNLEKPGKPGKRVLSKKSGKFRKSQFTEN